MRKIEIVLVVLTMVSVVVSLFLVPGADVFAVLAFSALAFFYLYLGFALFNGISLRGLFKRDSYKGVSLARISAATCVGMALSISIIGMCFRVYEWPGSLIFFKYGFGGLVIAAILCIVKYRKSRSLFYRRTIKRIVVVGFISIVLFAIPKTTWNVLKYQKSAEFVKSNR
jgi:hypothetical protein